MPLYFEHKQPFCYNLAIKNNIAYILKSFEMKKTLTLALILGCATALSAQYLHRTEKVTGKQWSRTDQFLINLDTMPDIQFAFVRHGNRWGTRKIFTFDIGDGFKWELVDKDSKLIEADNIHHSKIHHSPLLRYPTPHLHLFLLLCHKNFKALMFRLLQCAIIIEDFISGMPCHL